MGSHATWSVSLGRWGGLRFRLHGFFLLFAALTLLFGWQASQLRATQDALLFASISLGILFVSVLLHELGHLTVTRRLGADCDELVLGPLGGMVPVRAPADAHAELLVHIAGPLVNLTICLTAGAVLMIGTEESLLPLLHPLAPANLIDGAAPWIQGAKLVFWINWLLFLVNLLPAFPFDGGRALRAALARLWPQGHPRRPSLAVALVAKVAAVGLIILAVILLVRPSTSDTVVPTWFALLLLAIFLYFSARQEEERQEERDIEDELFGYDFSQGYTSLERSTERRHESTGIVQHWIQQRRRARDERQQQLEADEERRVDEILTRLHELGIESLSEEDRAVLQRVSARYRQRR